ncbi:leucine--tRNA ligase [archaeon]|jgi:leucyl-tRNA synthetase|nr:leucine--tRNA ligase [archaeon]MDP6547917.1 leucine--tRNA ligase [Candidatus Woesearchaeota archaeon]|tara:strand:- start:127166 stop:129637 length:2472 start_codon:yes stop_codon:yes gene_type:complete
MGFNKIAEKWQKKWDKANIFRTKEEQNKKKMYVLEMYPYPSSYGLHMGHARNYSIGDAYARFKRMQGFNVLYPMGYDAFGLPAENAAIKDKINPKEYTEKAIENIMRQQKELGLSYDWNRLIASCDEDYYKWNQLFFLEFLKKELVYQKEAPVNFCPKCDTVLANEQVEQGKCWRCESQVEIKPLKQWFFKITKYADRLLNDLKKIEGWPNKIKIMQENWIGKSKGTEVNFKIEDTNEIIPIFTTRPDTLYGATFMVFAPEHPMIIELVKGTWHETKAMNFIKKTIMQDKFKRTAKDTEKEGFFTGKYAINPLTDEKIPIYIGNFVLLEYGSGAIMAVPAHDQRDFEFAKKYKIQIKVVIQPDEFNLDPKKISRAYIGEGTLVNSGKFDGIKSQIAREKITEFLAKKKLGKSTYHYKLRDWGFSRQRYWGTPIPVIYCDKCGLVPVDKKDLPVKLPLNVKFTSSGNILSQTKSFIEAKCPKCSGKAKRESDTMDGFVDSCWYFLRFTSPKEKNAPFDKKKAEYWLPVDQYIGGAEHAVMHLLYARFFCKVLKDLNYIGFDEPFSNLFNQGIVYKDGAKMSKSKGNMVSQEEISKKYGIDTARLFLLFVASPDKAMEWDDKGIEGSYRFINKVCNMSDSLSNAKSDEKILNKMNRTIKDVTADIAGFRYNNGLVKIWEYADYLAKHEKIPKESFKNLLLLLAPFIPHVCEELWEKIGNKPFISTQKWPEYDKTKISDKIEKEEAFIQNILSDIRNILKLVKIKPSKAYLYAIPNEKSQLLVLKNMFEKEIGLEFNVYAVNDKEKYDPQGKAKKAKPGKPAIFLE